MTLQASYERYLAKPTAAAFSADAAIHYIPTLSTFVQPQNVLKHLELQNQQLSVKTNVLNVIEGNNALCLETETTIRFLLGGGSYLPGLDDNFLADRTVSLPIIHIVEFDASLKILQIRLLWDQASMLKSVEIIGNRARNWPIYDGKDQARLIASSISHAPQGNTESVKSVMRKSKVSDNTDHNGHLSLFEPREFEGTTSGPNPVDPRESAKPNPRPYDEVFGDDEPLSPSPSKGPQFKGGAGHNFQSNRLFDEQTHEPLNAPNKSVKTNPSKFNHFDMNETSIGAAVGYRANTSRTSQQAAQWSFADFATPQKPAVQFRDRNERTLTWTPDEAEARKPDVRIPYRPAARKDAAAHFAFGDTTPPAEKRAILKENVKGRSGLYHDPVQGEEWTSGREDRKLHLNERPTLKENVKTISSGLYHDPVMGEEWTSGREEKKSHLNEPAPLTNITNNAARKNFTSHFDMSDASPHKKPQTQNENVKPVAPQKTARSMVATSWDFYDDEPVLQRGIKIAGDGMGNRKTTEKNWWEME